MVLCLPFLLILAALMVNLGELFCWRIQAHSVARHAVWGSRPPRKASSNPRPDYWPAAANVKIDSAADAPGLDDPRVHLPVARGPLPFGAEVNERLLDPTRQFRRGSAGLHGRFPMLRTMGTYQLEATTELLDDKWQYWQMGLGSNRRRRIPVIYALAKAPPGVVDAYVQAALTLLNAPFQPQLAPLDRDEEFLYYRGYAPDFHPRLRMFTSLDRELASRRVEDLVDRIQGKVERDEQGRITRRIPGVPEKMTRAFIRLYESVIEQLESQSQPGPPPPGVQAQIRELERKIEILRQFLATLQNQHDN